MSVRKPLTIDPRTLSRQTVPAPPHGALKISLKMLEQTFLASNPECKKGHFSARLSNFELHDNDDAQNALKPAAVLIGIIPHGDNLDLILTRRTAHLRAHASEIALPGGRRDATDRDDIACALREAAEEVALPAHAARVLGTLPAYVSGSGYRVRPVVAAIAPEVKLQANASEVAEIFRVPLDFILNPQHHFRQCIEWDNRLIQWWAMPWENPENLTEYYIWGATAGILRSFYDFLAIQLKNQDEKIKLG